MTLTDDEGRLVWSRALSGALNLRSGPLLLVPPKVSPRAHPEHIAFVAGWLVDVRVRLLRPSTEHDARLQSGGAAMGMTGTPVQVRNHDGAGVETERSLHAL